MGRNGEVIIIRLSITPSANRNTYSVATLIIHIPRVEALYASTLGYEIATPTELPGVRTIHAKAKPTAAATAFCVYVIPL